jgi:sugar O-acyltransferase (sialic acid O-acetyltransferase NeuD family)
LKRLLVAGAGRGAELLARTLLLRSGRRVDGYAVDAAFLEAADRMDGVRCLDEALATEDPRATEWLIGVADFRTRLRGRASIADRILAAGHGLAGFIDPSAVVDPDGIDPAAVIFPGVVVDALASIGPATVVRSGAVVGHHSRIGRCCYLAPGVRLAGCVTVSDRTFIGVGATIRDHVSIGEGCLIGAGAVVLADVPDGTVVVDRHEPSTRRRIDDAQTS